MSKKNLPFIATLVRGNVYFLGNTRFDKDAPVPVSQKDRDYLEEEAVDTVNAEGGETFVKPKFEFDHNPDYVEPTTAELVTSATDTGGPVIEGLDTDLDDDTDAQADDTAASADSKPSGAGNKPATRAATRRNN